MRSKSSSIASTSVLRFHRGQTRRKHLGFAAGPEPSRNAVGEDFSITEFSQLIARLLDDGFTRLAPPHQGLLIAATDNGAKIQLRQVTLDVDHELPHVAPPRRVLRSTLVPSRDSRGGFGQGGSLILRDGVVEQDRTDRDMAKCVEKVGFGLLKRVQSVN